MSGRKRADSRRSPVDSADRDLIERFLNAIWLEEGLSRNSVAAYRTDLIRFNLFLKEKEAIPVSRIDTGVILTYLIHLRSQGLGARSRSRHLVSLRGFFKFLKDESNVG